MIRRPVLLIVAGLVVLTNVITALVAVLSTRSTASTPAADLTPQLAECRKKLNLSAAGEKVEQHMRDRLTTQQSDLVICLAKASALRESKDCVAKSIPNQAIGPSGEILILEPDTEGARR